VDPDLESDEAKLLLSTIPDLDYANAVVICLENLVFTEAAFNDPDFGKTLKLVAKKYDGPPKYFWSTLRHAITGRKAGPTLPETLAILGPQETRNRLRSGLEMIKRLL